MDEEEMALRLRALERVMMTPVPGTIAPQPRVAPDIAGRFEAAEKTVTRIVESGALKDADAEKFRKISDVAIRDAMRESLRGGAGEVAATVNVTVAGTGTVSVS